MDCIKGYFAPANIYVSYILPGIVIGGVVDCIKGYFANIYLTSSPALLLVAALAAASVRISDGPPNHHHRNHTIAHSQQIM